MDASTILGIKPALTEYLHEFDGCMGRAANLGHLETYVTGQLGDLPRKSIEPMADAADVPARTLQEFLGNAQWDESAARDCLQQRVARRHGHPHGIGIIDETSYAKKGDKTACVQRQHCGSRGKTDNCVVSVHLGYVAGDFHALIDGDLFVPEKTWNANRERCRSAGIPDDVVYRSKSNIALEQHKRARGNGVRFEWLTFDEWYGGKPEFMRKLDRRGQNFVGEIPCSLVGWTRPPEVLLEERSNHRKGGRARKLPRLKVRNRRPCAVRDLLMYSPVLRAAPWVRHQVRDGEKGPMVWEAKCIPFWIKDEKGLPSRPHRLLVARGVMDPTEVKYFLSNASEGVPIETLLLVAFSRWRIERMFEDSKGELGLDHFEVRKYISIRRHLILTCVSHLFLAEYRLKHGGEKSGPDGLPNPHGHADAGAVVEPRRPLLAQAGRIDRRAIGDNPGAKRQGPRFAPQENRAAIAGHRRQAG